MPSLEFTRCRPRMVLVFSSQRKGRRCLLPLFLVFGWSLSVCSAQMLDLDGDTDRTGKIEGSDREETLEKSHSVIVINNCDLDGKKNRSSRFGPEPDNFDDVVNGEKDRLDIEPVVLRRAVSLPDKPIRLVIERDSSDSVPVQKRVRVFGRNGREILGPITRATSYTLTKDDLQLLRKDDLQFHIEGLSFATSVNLSVQVNDTVHDRLNIEVAPFIFTPNHLAARENYVVHTGSRLSARYVDEFERACNQAGVKAVAIERIPDVWIEDEISWGYTQSARQRLDLALHMLRLRQLMYAKSQILRPDLGWAPAFDYRGKYISSLTSGGNVEVSPPTRRHKMGRLYYGSKIKRGPYPSRGFTNEFRAFFERQAVQPPIELHTNWLLVGHIDEVVSCVPRPSGGFALVVASPKKAYEILDEQDPNTPLHKNYAMEFYVRTVRDLYHIARRGKKLRRYNEDVDQIIFGYSHLQPGEDSIVGTLMRELDLDVDDIVEVPVVFVNEVEYANTWGALALNPDLANLSSMGEYVLMGEQFFDPFKKYVEREFAEKIGVKVNWIDNWHLYHRGVGGVHCGSNERRRQFSSNWWEQENEAN